ncbi:MAG: hypothetical protein IKG55_07725, partial [Solobacterium sp.]|nr:hypothetical protein [Solobacterium sp.]
HWFKDDVIEENTWRIFDKAAPFEMEVEFDPEADSFTITELIYNESGYELPPIGTVFSHSNGNE